MATEEIDVVDRAKLGVVVPLFVSPQRDQSSWIQLAGTARRYPRVSVIAAVDINMGPGLGPDPVVREGVKTLKNNAVTVLGYVMLGSDFNLEEVKQQMINWKTWYPELDGFYIDGVPREHGNVQYIDDIVDYAKNFLNCTFVVAELDHEVRMRERGVRTHDDGIPRDLVDRSHIDLFIIYRGRGLPAPLAVYKNSQQKSGIGKWTDEDYPSHRFGIIATKMDITQTTVIENFIREAIREDVARYFYIQTDSGAREIHPEPFATLSSFFEPIVILLDNIAATEGKLPTPPPTQQSMTPIERIPGASGDSPTANVEPKPQGRLTIEDNRAEIGDKDQNGIQKIYPTAKKGSAKEWYFRQDGEDPTKDPRLKNWKESGGIRKTQDGTGAFYLNAKSGARLEAWSARGKNSAVDSEANKWLNTETTAYFFYIRDLANSEKEPYAFQLYSRSGHHSDKRGEECQGACYKSAIFKDGRSTIRQEVAHGRYAENRATQQGITAHPVRGHWVGFKQVVYNLDEDGEPDVYVVIENYVDQNCTDSDGKSLVVRNDWVLTSRFIDRGVAGGGAGIGWSLANPTKDEKKLEKLKCKSLDLKRQGEPRKASDIINTPGGTKDGNCCLISADGVELKFKHFSVREIVPPRED
jgi:hypothetical protein